MSRSLEAARRPAAAAVALREAGLTVAVLEKRLCGAGPPAASISEACAQQGRHLAELAARAPVTRACGTNLNHLLGRGCRIRGDWTYQTGAPSEADMAELERYAESAREHGLALTLLGANAVARRTAGGRTRDTRCFAIRRPTARPIRAWWGRPLCAARAQARRRGSGSFAPVRRAVSTGAGFEVEADGVTVRSHWLVNAAGAGAGVVASWFGERASSFPADARQCW